MRGVPVRRLDHVNLMAGDVPANRAFMQEVLGFKLREQKIGEGGAEVGAWLSVSALVHELALMRDASGARGRFHHVAYWYGAPQHLLDIADIFSDYGVRIEGGPAKHGTSQAYFLYCFEPGGNRVELFGDTGYLIFDPDWQTVVSRRARKEPPDKGGWNAFFTTTITVDADNVAGNSFLSGGCDKAWFGWPCDADLEKLRSAFARETDPAKQKELALAVSDRVMNQAMYIVLGQYKAFGAYRKDRVEGWLQSPAAIWWNISKKQ